MAYRNEKERMRNLNSFIIERLKLNKNSKVISKKYPNDYYELKDLIKNKFDKLKDNKEYLNLNDIDLSELKRDRDGDSEEPLNGLWWCIFDDLNKQYDYNLNIKQIDVSYWDMRNLKNLHGMFKGLDVEEIIGIDKWDMSNIMKINFLFDNCKNLVNVGDLGKWKFNKLVRPQGLFRGCHKIKDIGDISKWDMSNVKFIANMFNNCYKLENVGDISNWKLDSCLSYSRIFTYDSNLKNISDLTKWNTYIEKNIQDIYNRYGDLYDAFEDIFNFSSLRHYYEIDMDRKNIKAKIVKKI